MDYEAALESDSEELAGSASDMEDEPQDKWNAAYILLFLNGLGILAEASYA